MTLNSTGADMARLAEVNRDGLMDGLRESGGAVSKFGRTTGPLNTPTGDAYIAGWEAGSDRYDY